MTIRFFIFILIFTFGNKLKAQNFLEIGGKIQRLIHAEAKFTDVKTRERSASSVEMGNVKLADGSVSFADASCRVISPTKTTEEWAYIITFNPKSQDQRHKDFLRSWQVIRTTLEKEGSTTEKMGNQGLMLFHPTDQAAAKVLIAKETQQNQPVLVIYVLQPPAYFESKQTSVFAVVEGNHSLSTAFGKAQLNAKTFLNEYDAVYDKLTTSATLRFRNEVIIVRTNVLQAYYRVENGKIFLNFASRNDNVIDKNQVELQKTRGTSFSSALEAHQKVFQLFTKLFPDRYAKAIQPLAPPTSDEMCMLFESGHLYRGQRKGFIPHGKGKFYYLATGVEYSTYEGNVVEGVKTGLHRMEIVNAQENKTAVAENVRFINGKMDGTVILKHQGKPIYEIVYKQGKKLSERRLGSNTDIQKEEKTTPARQVRIKKVGRKENRSLYFTGKYMIDFIGLSYDDKNIGSLRQKYQMKVMDFSPYEKSLITKGIELTFDKDDFGNTYLLKINIWAPTNGDQPSVSLPFGLKIGQSKKETEAYQKNYGQYASIVSKDQNTFAIDLADKEAVLTYEFKGGKLNSLFVYDFDYYQYSQPKMAAALMEARKNLANKP